MVVLFQSYVCWKQVSEKFVVVQMCLGELQSECECLVWQIGELECLVFGDDEWDELNVEYQCLLYGQLLLEVVCIVLDVLFEVELSVELQIVVVFDQLDNVLDFDVELQLVVEMLCSVQVQLYDVMYVFIVYLNGIELDFECMQELDDCVFVWMMFVCCYCCLLVELLVLLVQWCSELQLFDVVIDVVVLE